MSMSLLPLINANHANKDNDGESNTLAIILGISIPVGCIMLCICLICACRRRVWFMSWCNKESYVNKCLGVHALDFKKGNIKDNIRDIIAQERTKLGPWVNHAFVAYFMKHHDKSCVSDLAMVSNEILLIITKIDTPEHLKENDIELARNTLTPSKV